MPYLLISHSRYQLEPGRTVLGANDDADVVLPAGSGSGPLLVIELTPTGEAAVRRADPGVRAAVNDDILGDEPVQLWHGAKLAVGDVRLIFGDERASGETDEQTGVPDEMVGVLAPPFPAEPVSDTGGVLISLGDGRRYAIPEAGLEIGRDPNCDLVLDSSGVSRWHASVAPGLFGYVICDSSTNGVFVNGQRVDEQRVLGRGDVIRIGDEELRFEGRSARYEPSTSLRLAAIRDDGGPAPGVATSSDAAGATAQPGPRASPAPPPTPADRVSLLATLEVIGSGLLNGRRFRVEHPLTHIGRGPHNEIVLGDESISGTHATLQRRGDRWILVDQLSTNGTYVDGDRVKGERVLDGPCELRFGGIKTVFRPIAGGGDAPDSTRGIVGVADPE